MSTTYLYWPEILYAVNTVLAGAAALAICRFERMGGKFTAFWKSPEGSALLDRAESDRLLKELDERISFLSDVIDSTIRIDSNDKKGQQELVFEKAMSLARHGATNDELVQRCGLSPMEASLLLKVHRPGASSQAPN